MEYDNSIDVAEDPDVYPPSEDSMLFIESLDVKKGDRVLEIGCGSGVVSLHCAKNGCIVTAGDINPKAVELTRKNAETNGLPLDVVETDVYSNITGRFDRILFNLPYLPVDEEGLLAKAWSGGPDGLGPLPELLEGAPDHLNGNGKVVIVASSLMDRCAFQSLLEKYDTRIVGEMKLFFETLSVVEIGF